MKTRNSTPVVVKILVQRRVKNRNGRDETLTKESLYDLLNLWEQSSYCCTMSTRNRSTSKEFVITETKYWRLTYHTVSSNHCGPVATIFTFDKLSHMNCC